MPRRKADSHQEGSTGKRAIKAAKRPKQPKGARRAAGAAGAAGDGVRQPADSSSSADAGQPGAVRVEKRSPRGRTREGQPKHVRGTPAGLFGEHLERLMIEAGLNPGELADRMGVQADLIRKYIRGLIAPNFKSLPSMAKALGLKTVRDIVPDIALPD